MPVVPYARSIKRSVVIFFLSAALISCRRGISPLQHAGQLEREENWEEAVIVYNRALTEMKPTQVDVRAETYSHIGRCLMELGRGTEALLSLEKALTLNPNSPDAHLRMAQLMIAADIPAQAEPHLAYLNSLRPNDAEVIQARG